MSKFWIKATAFLVKYWYIAAGAVLVFIWFILALGGKGQPLKKWRGVQKKITEIEERKEDELELIEIERAVLLADIDEHHEKTLGNLTTKQKERADVLRKNPRRLNRYLNSLLPK